MSPPPLIRLNCCLCVIVVVLQFNANGVGALHYRMELKRFLSKGVEGSTLTISSKLGWIWRNRNFGFIQFFDFLNESDRLFDFSPFDAVMVDFFGRLNQLVNRGTKMEA